MAKPRIYYQNGLWHVCTISPIHKAWGLGLGIWIPVTSGPTLKSAWGAWYEHNRLMALKMIPTAATINILGRSKLCQKCDGLIRHDRHLLKVESRQPGDKGSK